MKDFFINRWKDSASESFAQNGDNIEKNGCFYFQITTEQKEYLEKHISDIDDWCEQTIGEIPTTIMFEPFDGEYTCDCYFK